MFCIKVIFFLLISFSSAFFTNDPKSSCENDDQQKIVKFDQDSYAKGCDQISLLALAAAFLAACCGVASSFINGKN